jgi:uncharacterized RDD family membrane protein YckC
VVTVLIYNLYSLFFLCFSGQTIGMMIAEIQVVDSQRDIPNHMQAIGRTLVFLFSLVTGVGLLWPLFHKKCRGLQDIFSHTEIIRIQDST